MHIASIWQSFALEYQKCHNELPGQIHQAYVTPVYGLLDHCPPCTLFPAGEDYDGKGACTKWTDKWAERMVSQRKGGDGRALPARRFLARTDEVDRQE